MPQLEKETEKLLWWIFKVIVTFSFQLLRSAVCFNSSNCFDLFFHLFIFCFFRFVKIWMTQVIKGNTAARGSHGTALNYKHPNVIHSESQSVWSSLKMSPKAKMVQLLTHIGCIRVESICRLVMMEKFRKGN